MTSALMLTTIGSVPDLDSAEQSVLMELFTLWSQKLARNRLRTEYYDQHNVLKNLGISLPPHLTDLELVLGWPAKAVDTLAKRCKLERFAIPGMETDEFGIDSLWRANDMTIELPQTLTSAFVQSFSMLMVTKGDVSAGEPEVLVSSQSAQFGSGLWNPKSRQLRAALAITETTNGRVTGWAMFLPNVTITAAWTSSGGWSIDRFYHSLGRVPVEVIPYNPRLERPFGMSRISRAVMGLTDAAMRTVARMEVHAEFFSTPQRYAMGADESMFVDDNGDRIRQWDAIIGRVWAAPRDPETGDLPQLGQFPQSSPQPHTDQLRALAAQFSAETSLPLNALGIVQDNPSSAQAIEAAERHLIIEARSAMDTFGPRIARAMAMAVQIRDNLDSIPEPLNRMDVVWRDPENMPKSSAGDFLIKVIQAMPWLADSVVPLEQLGWDETTIQRAWADKRRGSVTNLLQNLNRPQLNGDDGIGG